MTRRGKPLLGPHISTDDRVAGLPMVIETGDVETMHAVNLALLRWLRASRGRA